jgi:hypothetical protein
MFSAWLAITKLLSNIFDRLSTKKGESVRLRITTEPKRPRTLRQFKRIAQRDHGPCYQCNREIKAGDEYEGYVKVQDRRLWVLKAHMICPEEWLDEQEELVRECAAHQTSLPKQRQIAA